MATLVDLHKNFLSLSYSARLDLIMLRRKQRQEFKKKVSRTNTIPRKLSISKKKKPILFDFSKLDQTEKETLLAALTAYIEEK